MPDTLPNVILPVGVWVDLYAATGIDVGTRILVQNIGHCDVYLVAQAAEPVDDTARQVLTRSQYAINDLGDDGAWAFCTGGGGVNVRIP